MKKMFMLLMVIAALLAPASAEKVNAAEKFDAKVIPSGNTLTFTWEDMGNRTYYLYRQNRKFYGEAMDWDHVKTIKKGSGCRYEYKIPASDKEYDWVYQICYKKNGVMHPSKDMPVWHHVSKTNPKIKYTKTKNGFRLSWNKLKGNGYIVYRKVNGKWRQSSQCYYDTTSVHLTGYPKGTYYFYVRPFVYTEDIEKKLGGKTADKLTLKSGKKIKVTVK